MPPSLELVTLLAGVRFKETNFPDHAAGKYWTALNPSRGGYSSAIYETPALAFIEGGPMSALGHWRTLSPHQGYLLHPKSRHAQRRD